MGPNKKLETHKRECAHKTQLPEELMNEGPMDSISNATQRPSNELAMDILLYLFKVSTVGLIDTILAHSAITPEEYSSPILTLNVIKPILIHKDPADKHY